MDPYTTHPSTSQLPEYQFTMTSPQHTSFSAPVRISRIYRDWNTPQNTTSTHSPPTQVQQMLPPSPTTPPPEPMIHILSPAPTEIEEPKVPRPANAFMLFRSDFLKRGIVPKSVERRQQNLSRLAAMKWNTMSKEEREYWDSKAQEVCKEHRLRYPDYKFQPSPRGSKKNKGAKSRAEAAANNLEHLDNVRLKYLNMSHAPPPSSRRKKEAKKARSEHRVDATPASPFVASGSDSSQQSTIAPSTPALLTTTPIIPSFATPARQRGSKKTNPTATTSLPHTPLGASTVRDLPVWQSAEVSPRRPSTSLGFVEQMRQMQLDNTYRAGTTSPAHQPSDQERLLYPLTTALSSPSIPPMSLPTPSSTTYGMDSPCSPASSNWMPPTPRPNPIELYPLVPTNDLKVAFHSYENHAALNAPLSYQASNHIDSTINMDGLIYDLSASPAPAMNMYDHHHQTPFSLAAGPSQVSGGITGLDGLGSGMQMMDFVHPGAGEQNGLGLGVTYDAAVWALGYNGNGCA